MEFRRDIKPSMLRRCRGWDYRQPCIYQITLVLADRRSQALGRLVIPEAAASGTEQTAFGDGAAISAGQIAGPASSSAGPAWPTAQIAGPAGLAAIGDEMAAAGGENGGFCSVLEAAASSYVAQIGRHTSELQSRI